MNNLLPLLVITLIFGLFTPRREVHWVFYTLALACYGVYQLGKRRPAQLVLRRSLTQAKGFAGDAITLRVALANASWLPVFWGVFYQNLPPELGALRERRLFTLPPRSEKEFAITFAGNARGVYLIPETRIVLGDAWGGPEQVLRLEDRQPVLLFPRILPLTGLAGPRHLPLGRLKVLFGLHEDPARLRGCRDYAPGDSLKRIHWPNLARTGRIQVKEWESTLNADFIVALDLQEVNYPVSEWQYLREVAIELAASVNHRLVNEGESVGFFCNGRTAGSAADAVFKLTPRRGRGQEIKVLSYLAGVNLSAGPSLEGWLGEGERLPVGSCLILITPLLTPEVARRAGNLRNKGYHPLFLQVPVSKAEAPPLELEKAQVPVFTVEKGRESHEFQLRRAW